MWLPSWKKKKKNHEIWASFDCGTFKVRWSNSRFVISSHRPLYFLALQMFARLTGLPSDSSRKLNLPAWTCSTPVPPVQSRKYETRELPHSLQKSVMVLPWEAVANLVVQVPKLTNLVAHCSSEWAPIKKQEITVIVRMALILSIDFKWWQKCYS